MSAKRRHEARQEMLKARALREKLDTLAHGVVVDSAAIVPHNSHSQPDFVETGLYTDRPFKCRGCGVPQVWRAEQQKWWYEVAKGSVFSGASLCRSCRRRERERKAQAQQTGGSPNRYQRPEDWLAKVRSDLEPELISAGYTLVGRRPRDSRRHYFLDFGRSDELVTISWDRFDGRLAAEWLKGEPADLEVIAETTISGPTTMGLEESLAAFVVSVREFLTGPRRLAARCGTSMLDVEPEGPENRPTDSLSP